MQVAIVGLGRMGKNICLHLMEQGVEVVAYNRSRDDIDEMVAKGAIGVYPLSEISQKLTEQIVVILFVPSGSPVDEVLFGASSWRESRGEGRPIGSPNRSGDAISASRRIQHDNNKGLADILPKGSIIIDGGNSFYKDSQRRHLQLKEKGLHFLDMGTSGGLEGARNGACLMVGGDEQVYKQVKPLLAKIAINDGYAYFGPSGAGHFVKMVHNGIEYAIVQAFGEGFEILKKGPFTLDLAQVAKVYSHGSVIRSWIVELLTRALEKDPELASFSGKIAGGESGVWTYLAAKELGVAAPGIKTSLTGRKKSQVTQTFATKVISALRNQWGEHSEGRLHPSLEKLDLE